MRTLLTAAAVTGTMLAVAGPASAATAADAPATAAAVTCFGGAASFTKPAGVAQAPQGPGVFFRTSSRCRDINIRPNNGTSARVCFEATGCQLVRVPAPALQWTVIATNVRDGALFRIDFGNVNVRVTGQYAA
jgi:hypothetical protein